MTSYQPLPTTEGSEEGHCEKQAPTRRGISRIAALLMTVVTAAVSLGVGYSIGLRHSANVGLGLLEPSGTIISPMIYNKTYTLAPAPDSDAAWKSIFPKGVGFVKHPTVSPELSGLAVFHELHCVNMLRVAYYAALDGSLDAMQDITDENQRPDDHHTRHCFDYLRQSLMCNADTNLEPVDFSLGGVTGWKFDRKCRNFDAIKDWAETYRSWDPALPVGGHN